MKANNTDTAVSTQGQEVKRFVQIPITENTAGNESGVSDTAGRGAVAAAYVAPSGNTGINGTASGENRSAQFKAPNVSDDAGQYGSNQYQ